MTFQRRNWLAERFAWLVMAAVLVAAALGLFAGGPLSSTSAGDAGGTLRADYGRMQRLNSRTMIKLTVAGSAATADGVDIDLHNTFMDALKLTNIRPEPVSAAALADRMRLRFATAKGQDAVIYFYVSPEKIGRARLRLGLAGADPLELPIFIYP